MTHVMNFEEIKEAAEKRNVVWQEFKSKEKMIPMIFDGTDFVNISNNKYLLLCECDEEDCWDYNWQYRLWNNMPTTLERKKTKWKDDPYA